MHKIYETYKTTEVRRFLAAMEFCYGFLFGVALFGATLTFLIVADFIPAILFAVCIFAFFIFLATIVRYCIMRIKLTNELLDVTSQTLNLQEHILQTKQETVTQIAEK